MVEVTAVKRRYNTKIYYYLPCEENLNRGDSVLIQTNLGLETATVIVPKMEITNKEAPDDIQEITRKMTDADIEKDKENREKEADAEKICTEKIAEHNLNMKIIGVHLMFDGKRLLFYFHAETRVDFRALVKDLAQIFRTRIELRQVGVRDEAKLYGGIGICGREYCCRTFLSDFQPVSIKMAKDQSLSLNPTKISGACGRLMCCLKFEEGVYEELLKITPRIGAIVKCGDKTGKVVEANVLSGRLSVIPNGSEMPVPMERSDVEIIRNGSIQNNAIQNVDKETQEELKKLEKN